MCEWPGSEANLIKQHAVLLCILNIKIVGDPIYNGWSSECVAVCRIKITIAGLVEIQSSLQLVTGPCCLIAVIGFMPRVHHT